MAATQARPDRPTSPPTGHIDEARAAVLRAANINPRTGLATDYLNHFNEKNGRVYHNNAKLDKSYCSFNI